MAELRRALTVWSVLALAGLAVFGLSLAVGSVSLDARQL
ncbi:MAG: iron ABC transporter permease, partial [Cupriavidus sp.]|nr:iron ABC transporter permease [Cupriavidus sp.]